MKHARSGQCHTAIDYVLDLLVGVPALLCAGMVYAGLCTVQLHEDSGYSVWGGCQVSKLGTDEHLHEKLNDALCFMLASLGIH